MPCGSLRTIEELLEDRQLRERNMLRYSGEGAESDGIRYAGNPIKVSGMTDPERGALPPALDADRAKILAELGLDRG